MNQTTGYQGITTIDKFIAPAIGVILIILTALAGPSSGLDAQTVKWIQLALLVLTPISAYFATNKNTATLSPGEVVVARSQIVPAAAVVAVHRP